MGLKLYSQVTAAGTALTNSTTQTVFGSGSVSFPANFFQAGMVLKFDAVVQATATNSTDTLTVDVFFGGTTLTTSIGAGNAIDVANGDDATITGTITVRDADSSGTHVAQVRIDGPDAAGVGATEGTGTITGSVDFTGVLLLEIAGTWSAASTGDSARLESFNVYTIV